MQPRGRNNDVKKYEESYVARDRTEGETDYTLLGVTTDISVARGVCVRGPV